MKFAISIVVAISLAMARAEPVNQDCLQARTRALVSRFYALHSTETAGDSDILACHDDYIECNLSCYGLSRSKSQEDRSGSVLGIDPPE